MPFPDRLSVDGSPADRVDELVPILSLLSGVYPSFAFFTVGRLAGDSGNTGGEAGGEIDMCHVDCAVRQRDGRSLADRYVPRLELRSNNQETHLELM